MARWAAFPLLFAVLRFVGAALGGRSSTAPMRVFELVKRLHLLAIVLIEQRHLVVGASNSLLAAVAELGSKGMGTS